MFTQELDSSLALLSGQQGIVFKSPDFKSKTDLGLNSSSVVYQLGHWPCGP